jgi:hypothetical protein
MWHLIKSLGNVISEVSIDEDYLSYYTSDYVLHFINKNNSLEVNSIQLERDSNYALYNEKLYLSNDGELKIIDIPTHQIFEKFDSGKQYIFTLSENLYIASSYIRTEKKYENIILTNKKEPAFEINGEYAVNEYFNPYLFLFNREKDKIAVVDVYKEKLLWDSILTDKVNGKSIMEGKFLIVPLTQSTIKYEIDTGKVLWNLAMSLPYLRINDQKTKLFSLNAKSFELIDVETGERELQKELSENLHIASHLTYYTDGYLYFSGYRDNNIPVFGAVDVKTGELVFTQTVEMPGEKSFRKGLDRPVVVGNRLYVRDAMKTLHIYERIDTET